MSTLSFTSPTRCRTIFLVAHAVEPPTANAEIASKAMLKALTELGLASGRLDDARKYLGLVEAEFPGQRPWIIEARKKLADAEAKGVATARG